MFRKLPKLYKVPDSDQRRMEQKDKNLIMYFSDGNINLQQGNFITEESKKAFKAEILKFKFV